MTIGIAVCTYNGQKYIKKQLDSIFNQTLKPDLVKIFDDCSKDSTSSIVSEYCRGKENWHFIQRTVNVGYRQNFNDAALQFSTDILFFSDQDDIWYPNKIEVIVKHFKDTNASLVFSSADIIDENDTKLNKTSIDLFQIRRTEIRNLKEKFNSFIDISRRNIITGATMAIKLKDYSNAYPFPKHIIHDHWITLFSILNGYNIVYIRKSLMQYRIHPDQQLGAGSGTSLRNVDLDLQRKYFEDELLERLDTLEINHIDKDEYKKRLNNQKLQEKKYLHLVEVRKKIRRQPFFIRIIMSVRLLKSGKLKDLSVYLRQISSTKIVSQYLLFIRDIFFR